MRITITNEEFNRIQKILLQNDMSLYDRFNEEFKKSILSCTPKKIKATNKANIAKRKKSRNAITNAVNILRFEDKILLFIVLLKQLQLVITLLNNIKILY